MNELLIQILNKRSNHPQGEILHARTFFQYASTLLKSRPISFVYEPCDFLAVDWNDLIDPYPIPWNDINIIFTETYHQIAEAIYKLDPEKKYIFVSESYIEDSVFKEQFGNLNVLGYFYNFKESYDYGIELFSPQSHLNWIRRKDNNIHDFFCLIGRRTNLRSRIAMNLLKGNSSNSLIKYHGETLSDPNQDETYDFGNYASVNFYNDYYNIPGGMTKYSKLIQESLYNNFKYEVQIETDPRLGEGWNFVEYHVTEKTIKPLLMNKPCLMLGPQGYNQWLKDSFDIDLSHGNFDLSFDQIASDTQRVDTFVAEAIKHTGTDIKSNHVQSLKNFYGLRLISKKSSEQYIDLYNLLISL